MATAINDRPPKQTTKTTAVPNVSPTLLYWFDWYLQRYLPRHFHAFAVNNSTAARTISDQEPLIVYMNHASWWDPLVALMVSKHFFPTRKLYAPIDAEAVAKYPFMQRLGFFPVTQNQLHGAGEFLKTARAILHSKQTSIWMTPEGQFADPRQTDLPFQPGLAHLVSRLEHGVVLPLAIEYPFWEERLPEALARFGEPIRIEDNQPLPKEEWTTKLEAGLRDTQHCLKQDSVARNSDAFEILYSGQAGVGWMYDLIRWARSVLTGKTADTNHGDKLQ